MKCTQCGCNDLEEVDFPYHANLIMTRCGLVGEASFYDLEEEFEGESYICTKCGHFEFFNKKLAETIIEKRAIEEKKRAKIEEIEEQILEKDGEIEMHKADLNIVLEQLNDLDITIRQSNELKEKKAELIEQINTLQEEIKSLQQQKNRLY